MCTVVRIWYQDESDVPNLQIIGWEVKLGRWILPVLNKAKKPRNSVAAWGGRVRQWLNGRVEDHRVRQLPVADREPLEQDFVVSESEQRVLELDFRVGAAVLVHQEVGGQTSGEPQVNSGWAWERAMHFLEQSQGEVPLLLLFVDSGLVQRTQLIDGRVLGVCRWGAVGLSREKKHPDLDEGVGVWYQFLGERKDSHDRARFHVQRGPHKELQLRGLRLPRIQQIRVDRQESREDHPFHYRSQAQQVYIEFHRKEGLNFQILLKSHLWPP